MLAKLLEKQTHPCSGACRGLFVIVWEPIGFCTRQEIRTAFCGDIFCAEQQLPPYQTVFVSWEVKKCAHHSTETFQNQNDNKQGKDDNNMKVCYTNWLSQLKHHEHQWSNHNYIGYFVLISGEYLHERRWGASSLQMCLRWGEKSKRRVHVRKISWKKFEVNRGKALEESPMWGEEFTRRKEWSQMRDSSKRPRADIMCEDKSCQHRSENSRMWYFWGVNLLGDKWYSKILYYVEQVLEVLENISRRRYGLVLAWIWKMKWHACVH